MEEKSEIFFKKSIDFGKEKYDIMRIMKNEAYSMKERPGDNIVFWATDGRELYCRELNGVCEFANENEGAEKFRFVKTESGLTFSVVEIFIMNKESSNVDTRRGSFCVLVRNEDGTLRLPSRRELHNIYDFIDGQREYQFYAQIDSFFA